MRCTHSPTHSFSCHLIPPPSLPRLYLFHTVSLAPSFFCSRSSLLFSHLFILSFPLYPSPLHTPTLSSPSFCLLLSSFSLFLFPSPTHTFSLFDYSPSHSFILSCSLCHSLSFPTLLSLLCPLSLSLPLFPSLLPLLSLSLPLPFSSLSLSVSLTLLSHPSLSPLSLSLPPFSLSSLSHTLSLSLAVFESSPQSGVSCFALFLSPLYSRAA